MAHKYDYLMCLDFEATCWDGNNTRHEIIEFPSVVVDCKKLKIINRIEQFVKPKNDIELTDFCKNFTSITQAQVDSGIPLKEALRNHWNFVKKYPNSILVTCGDWDLKTMLYNDAKVNNLTVFDYYNTWINIKIAYNNLYNTRSGGMDKMMEKINLVFEGRQHRGIDDSYNLARICIKMLEDGWFPKVTSDYNNH